MLLALILLPLAVGLLALAWRDDQTRPWLLPLAAGGHSALVWGSWLYPQAAPTPWFGLDPLGQLILSVLSALYLGCSIYAVGYLRQTPGRDNRLFTACLLFMQAAASLVALSRHMGLLWVGMEATTLASAPLIHFKRNDRSLEATWKYLILCSVGIGLALLGTFFLALAGLVSGSGADPLLLAALLERGPALSAPWLKGAFIFLLVGYGTKMGLAPLHSWKPDAYGEAPGLAGAVLSGALTSCAFLGILRGYQVCLAAGQAEFAQSLLLLMGLLSMGTAAVFMIGQKDFKRLLAYSSVEHMGILALGLGLGGGGILAALLHLVNNALAKAVLFLAAGNIHRAFGHKTLDHVRGAWRRVPLSAGLFLAGFLAITGSPPFGPFISLFAVLRAAFESGRWGIAAAYAALLAAVFVGMASAALSVVQGEIPPQAEARPSRDSLLTRLAPGLFAAGVLGLGLYLPPWLLGALGRAAALLGGGAL